MRAHRITRALIPHHTSHHSRDINLSDRLTDFARTHIALQDCHTVGVLQAHGYEGSGAVDAELPWEQAVRGCQLRERERAVIVDLECRHGVGRDLRAVRQCHAKRGVVAVGNGEELVVGLLQRTGSLACVFKLHPW